MREIPLDEKQELLDSLLEDYVPKLAELIVAINDVLYQYHLDGGLPYFETDIEAKAVTGELLENDTVDVNDIESIIIKVYREWFGETCLPNGVPEPAVLAVCSAYQQYVKKQ